MTVKKIILSYGNAGADEGVFEGAKKLLKKGELSNYCLLEPILVAKETKNNLKNLNEVLLNIDLVAKKTKEALIEGAFPLFIGGDHSLSLGTVSAVSSHYDNLGLIWFDAHGDMNTNKTSPSGNIHGMILAALQGYGDESLTDFYFQGIKVKTSNVLIFGVRDLDSKEKELIKEKGVTYITYDEIKQMGLKAALKKVKNYFKNKTNNIHLSFDLDVLDPQLSPGVSVPVRKGFNFQESKEIIEGIFKDFNVTSMDIVEYNPQLDQNNQTLTYLLKTIKEVENLINSEK